MSAYTNCKPHSKGLEHNTRKLCIDSQTGAQKFIRIQEMNFLQDEALHLPLYGQSLQLQNVKTPESLIYLDFCKEI